MRSPPRWIVAQFGNPTGPLGHLAGFIMRTRPSNRMRNRRTVELLEIRPEERVLEIGFGPGLAIARAAELAIAGKVVGIDHSEVMLRAAAKRNAAAIRQGRVELRLGSAGDLPRFDAPFDKVLAVNVFMFWSDPATVLSRVRELMRPGGTIALTLQPRRPGATRDDTLSAAERMTAALGAAGFEGVRTEILEMAPVPAACVLGRRAG
jgi:ubiquinone/menaquinone biosynthesis C-methylase UbiE